MRSMLPDKAESVDNVQVSVFVNKTLQ